MPTVPSLLNALTAVALLFAPTAALAVPGRPIGTFAGTIKTAERIKDLTASPPRFGILATHERHETSVTLGTDSPFLTIASADPNLAAARGHWTIDRDATAGGVRRITASSWSIARDSSTTSRLTLRLDQKGARVRVVSQTFGGNPGLAGSAVTRKTTGTLSRLSP